MPEIDIETYVGTDDKEVIDEPVRVYWLSVGGDVGERGSFYLKDGNNNTSPSKWGCYVYNGGHYNFDPPIIFNQALYADIDTAAIKLYTIGFVKERVYQGQVKKNADGS